MARKLRTKPGRAAYGCRNTIVEPVFGQIMTCHNAGNSSCAVRTGPAASGDRLPPAACHNLRRLLPHASTDGLATLAT